MSGILLTISFWCHALYPISYTTDQKKANDTKQPACPRLLRFENRHRSQGGGTAFCTIHLFFTLPPWGMLHFTSSLCRRFFHQSRKSGFSLFIFYPLFMAHLQDFRAAMPGIRRKKAARKPEDRQGKSRWNEDETVFQRANSHQRIVVAGIKSIGKYGLKSVLSEATRQSQFI